MLEQTIIISLLSTTLLICFTKWGWIEYYQVHLAKKWMPFDCYFCFGFWIAVLLTIFYIFIKGFSLELIILPFASASLIRGLYGLANM